MYMKIGERGCVCVSGNACGYLISHPLGGATLLYMKWALSVYMYCRHKRFHTLFDLLKYGLMSKYNVLLPHTPAGAGHGHGSIVPPHTHTHTHTHKLEILDPSLKLNVLSCQDQLNRMPLQ